MSEKWTLRERKNQPTADVLSGLNDEDWGYVIWVPAAPFAFGKVGAVVCTRGYDPRTTERAAMIAAAPETAQRLADAEKRIAELEVALEQSASIADKMALRCLGDSVCDRCDHADCMEQRSMAKVCRGVAHEIRASGVHVA